MTTTLSTIPQSKSAGTTFKQRELVDLVRKLTDEAGLPPTVRELSAAAGTNVGDIHQKLERLRRDGVVIWRTGRARTLRIVGG